MAITPKRRLGDTGEAVAAKYLEGRGYTVVDRNYLKPWGEIDIVAKKGSKLHFVEVKTVSRDTSRAEGGVGDSRVTSNSYRPEDNVHPGKLRRLHRAIQTYLLDHRVAQTTDWQIDVACVYLDFATRRARVEMLENVIL